MKEKQALHQQRKLPYGLELALKLAGERLASIADLEGQCRKAGAELKQIADKKVITITYLNRGYQITLPEVDISFEDSQQPVAPRDKLLLLHYLSQAKGSPPTGTKITYKELPDGVNYFPVFYKRAIKPIVDNFGREPQRLLDAAQKLGAGRADYGNVAVTIDAFNRAPITLVLWHGDSELPPEGSILFDSTISDYLSAEDTTVLCEIIAWRLVKLSRET